MKKLILLIVIGLSLYSVYGPTMNFLANLAFSYPDNKDSLYSVDLTRNQSFETKKGITLSARLFRPRDLEKAPTILVRIPLTFTLENSLKSELIGRFWASRGYNVLLQGTRGRYRSSGTFYPLIHEREDGQETLAWIKQQSWFDGDLFMWGSSSFAHTQWAIADSVDPKIKGYFMHIGSSDFEGMFYPGGAFSLATAVYWSMRSRGQEDRDVVLEDLKKGVETLPIIEADNVALGDTDFYNDWVLNKNNHEFWKKIDGNNRTETIQSPVFFLAGWYDPFLITQIEDYKSLKSHSDSYIAENTRLIIGPWKHAEQVILPNGESVTYRENSIWPTIPWFDEILNKGIKKISNVKIFVMGVNEWREEQEWPLKRTVYKPYFFDSSGNANSVNGDGLLTPFKNDLGNVSDSFTYDPMNPVPTAGGAMLGPWGGIRTQNNIEQREDVLIYNGPTLEFPLEITGPVEAHLYVSSSAETTDFTVKLVDVYPDGNAYNISDGIIRLEDIPKSKDEPILAKIQLRPTSNVFLPGHKIRIEISSSNFPRYDRNLNVKQDLARGEEYLNADQIIYHSKDFPSYILLPTVPMD